MMMTCIFSVLYVQLQPVKCINCIINCNIAPCSYFPYVVSVRNLYMQLQTVKWINCTVLFISPSVISVYIQLQTVKWINCTVLFINPSVISEPDCATTETGTAKESISIDRESIQFFFFFVLGAFVYLQVQPLWGIRDEKWRSQWIGKCSMSWNLPKLSQLWWCTGGFGSCTTQNHLQTKQFVNGTWNSSRLAPCALRKEVAVRAHRLRVSSVCKNLITGLTSAASPRLHISSSCKFGQKLGEILYPLICFFVPCLSSLLRSQFSKSRRDLWITLYY